MDYNPYAPTKGALSGPFASAAERGVVDAQPASRWRRLTNLLIDTLGFLLLSGVCGIILGIAKLLFHVDMLASMGGAYETPDSLTMRRARRIASRSVCDIL
jgi:hypothetical protein